MQNSSDVRLPTPCTIPDAAAATTSYNNACTQVFAPAALAANLREHPEHRQGTPSLRMPELRVKGSFDPHSPDPIEQRIVFARWIIGNVRLGRDSSHLPRTSETWGLRGNTSASRSNTRPHGGSQNCEFLPDAMNDAALVKLLCRTCHTNAGGCKTPCARNGQITLPLLVEASAPVLSL